MSPKPQSASAPNPAAGSAAGSAAVIEPETVGFPEQGGLVTPPTETRTGDQTAVQTPARTEAQTEAQPEVHTVAQPEADAGSDSEVAPPADSVWTVIFALVFWGGIGLIWAFANDSSRAFIEQNRTVLIWTAIAVLAIGSLLGTQKRIRQSHAAVRAGLVLAFGVIPAAVLALLPEQAQIYTLRGLFLAIVIFTPTIMWWLFVVGQRESLLNEFLSNLDRLGLLTQSDAATLGESLDAHQTRVSSYLQKFEANFVRISPNVYKSVTEGRIRTSQREESNVSTPLATSAVPVLLTLLMLTIGWLLTLPLTASTTGQAGSADPLWVSVLAPTLTPLTAAFLGAYFFSLQMLFRRYVRRDLRGSAYVAVVMRIILALVGTWVITEVAVDAGAEPEDWQLLTTGFVIGVFPKVAWQIAQSIFAKFSRVVLPAIEAQLPLSELDGLTVWHEARLEEEDIENVPNMATADLVELLVSTRFPPDRLIDWVDQAILLTHLGPEQARTQRRTRWFSRNPEAASTTRSRLSTHGIRTATDLIAASQDAEKRHAGDAFAQAVGGGAGEQAVPALLAAMRTNCNLGRILTWRRMNSPSVVEKRA